MHRNSKFRRSLSAYSLSIGCFLVTSCVSFSALAQEPFKQIPLQSNISEIDTANKTILLTSLEKEIVISGDKVVDTFFVGAKKLVFKPDSKLIFSRTAVNGNSKMIVLAHEIISEDPTRPGTITWAGVETPPAAEPATGQGATGNRGVGHSGAGSAGANGNAGVTGVKGAEAPDLVLFVLGFGKAPPMINLIGQAGGIGGGGQTGGDGGAGENGERYSDSLTRCRRQGGPGGRGGNGGNGGQGGIGGRGGGGGTVTVVSVPGNFPTMMTLMRFQVAGGQGGDGGGGGAGGRPGIGGFGGPGGGHCHGGSNGSAGNVGQVGQAGSQGENGTQGDILYSEMDREKFLANFNN